MPQIEDERAPGFSVCPGDCIAGKYQLMRVLGQGAMGVVFEAKHLALAQSVAIKFLLPEHSAVATAASRFLCEARAAGRIRSEHVARILDTDTLPSGLPYIVMEYLSGASLADCLERRGPLPRAEAVDLLLQAAVGVAEAHAVGIVHRDLKPANLFLTTGSDHQPLVKVLDFGISKIRDHQVDGAITHRDSVLGSPHYMSPEQMRSPDSVDERSDVWSLGVILFELLCGRVPFPGRTLLAIFAEGLKTPNLREHCPDIPQELAAVVTRCLCRQRAERYSSVAELARALLPFGSKKARNWVDRIEGIAGVPKASTPFRPAQSPRHPASTATVSSASRGSRVYASALVGLALLALATLGAYISFRHRDGATAALIVNSVGRIDTSSVAPLASPSDAEPSRVSPLPRSDGLANGEPSSSPQPSRVSPLPRSAGSVQGSLARAAPRKPVSTDPIRQPFTTSTRHDSDEPGLAPVHAAPTQSSEPLTPLADPLDLDSRH